MDVGMKFRELRESKGLTKYRLTQLTGISGHHIKGIEEGSRQPTIDTLCRLLEAMGCTLPEFFNDSDGTVYLSERERILLENFRIMDKDKAEALLNLSCTMIK